MRVLKHAIIGLLIFTLVFLFLPTGQDGNAVVENFQATTSYATSFRTSAAQLVAPYTALDTVTPDDLDKGTKDEMSTVVAAGYLMCLEDGTPLISAPSSTYPRRGGSKGSKGNWNREDNTANTGAWHRGCDLVPEDGQQWNQPVYLCAFADGEVIQAGYGSSYGWSVVIKHSEYIYTRYAHMGWGYGASEDYGPTDPDSLPAYQRNFTELSREPVSTGYRVQGESTLRVAVGDKVTAGQALGVMGSTGSSTGMHGHIELLLNPNGWGGGIQYGGNIAKVVFTDATLADLTWYKHKVGAATEDVSGYLDLGIGVDSGAVEDGGAP